MGAGRPDVWPLSPQHPSPACRGKHRSSPACFGSARSYSSWQTEHCSIKVMHSAPRPASCFSLPHSHCLLWTPGMHTSQTDRQTGQSPPEPQAGRERPAHIPERLLYLSPTGLSLATPDGQVLAHHPPLQEAGLNHASVSQLPLCWGLRACATHSCMPAGLAPQRGADLITGPAN